MENDTSSPKDIRAQLYEKSETVRLLRQIRALALAVLIVMTGLYAIYFGERWYVRNRFAEREALGRQFQVQADATRKLNEERWQLILKRLESIERKEAGSK